MGLKIGGEVVGGLKIGTERVGGMKIGTEWIYRSVQPISIFDSTVTWGTTPGAVWSFTRSIAYSRGRILFNGDSRYRATQQIPTAYIQGGGNAFVTLLRLTASGDILELYLSTTVADSGTSTGPQFTEAAEDNLGLVIRAANGDTLKWRLSDLDELDETEPYIWRGVTPSISAAFITEINKAGVTSALVDISNDNVDWDNLQFRAA
ncbi:MAG: hypothetical protein OXF79_25895 [Chloroflexi bacterium]|nr:hypothetical protein [Chloroflexota bacterium]